MAQLLERNVAGKTRRGWVVKSILRSIFTGEFKGGDRLVEEEIALTLGVSRTPVREALGELASVWVITLKPNHGAIVRPFGPTQIRELYHVRRILETEASRLAAPRIDIGALEELRFEHDQLLHAEPRPHDWSARILALDQRFHERVARSSGSVRLAEEIDRYRGLIEAVREAVGNIAHAQDAALVEHLKVIERLLARDGEGAAEAMARHINRGTEAAVTALFSTTRQRAADAAAIAGKQTQSQQSASAVNVKVSIGKEIAKDKDDDGSSSPRTEPASKR
jgi:DNA-binding GntR family transcriptional regulator